MNLKLTVTFCDSDGKRFFGPGPYWLLRHIETTGSLRASAQSMGMAYTKAFGLVKRAEQEFGFPLIERKVGGKGGGGSVLTPKAKELLDCYEAYQAECNCMAQKLYQTHFCQQQIGDER